MMKALIADAPVALQRPARRDHGLSVDINDDCDAALKVVRAAAAPIAMIEIPERDWDRSIRKTMHPMQTGDVTGRRAGLHKLSNCRGYRPTLFPTAGIPRFAQ